jgi:replicative DNA helicase
MSAPKREAPHADTTIEEIVLGAILDGGPEGIEALLDLEPRDFSNLHHSEIFRACREHFEAGNPLELAAVGATLGNRDRQDLVVIAAQCFDAFGLPDRIQLGYYVEHLHQLEHLRRLARELDRARCALFDPELDYDERVEAVATALPDALEARQASRLGTARALVEEVLEVAERNATARKEGGDVDAISTGIPDLDQATGGFGPGKLVAVGARTGYGKTTSLSDFALTASRSVPAFDPRKRARAWSIRIAWVAPWRR